MLLLLKRNLTRRCDIIINRTFAPKIHKERIVGMLENYDFINDVTMAYFKKRVDQATDDADFVLDYAIKNAKTRQGTRVCV